MHVRTHTAHTQHARTQACTYTHARARKHRSTEARKRARTHTLACSHTATHAYAHAHTRTRTHTHAHARTHTRTHAHEHAHARTHTRTHAHANTRTLVPARFEYNGERDCQTVTHASVHAGLSSHRVVRDAPRSQQLATAGYRSGGAPAHRVRIDEQKLRTTHNALSGRTHSVVAHTYHTHAQCALAHTACTRARGTHARACAPARARRTSTRTSAACGGIPARVYHRAHTSADAVKKARSRSRRRGFSGNAAVSANSDAKAKCALHSVSAVRTGRRPTAGSAKAGGRWGKVRACVRACV
jgi:hypothetical protein